MKEEKYSNLENNRKNLKRFNLELAKSGKPICTRNGRKARIICFDKKGGDYPIIALIENDDKEVAYSFDKYGRSASDDRGLDLMMLPQKKEGWVNLTKSLSHNPHILNVIWDTKEEALDYRREAPANANIIATGKITWEE